MGVLGWDVDEVDRINEALDHRAQRRKEKAVPNYEDMIDGGWDAHVENKLAMAKARHEDGVHYFADSGSGYDVTQTSDKVKDGDVLVVESERIVGIMYDVAWPVAVTKAIGHFGVFHDIAQIKEHYAGQIEEAIALAKAKGFELQERFA